MLALAESALAHSYSPYSQFRVGAAALFEEGGVFAGTNVENGSYGATACAERVAIWTGVAAGKRRLVAIALVADSTEPVWPCGICLQVMAEFGPDATVLTRGSSGNTATAQLPELLRRPFGLPPRR